MDVVRYFIPAFTTLGNWYRPLLYSIISMISINVLVYSDLDRTADSVKMAYGDKENTFDFIIGKFS